MASRKSLSGKNGGINMNHLISLIQERPILWDKTCQLYKDRFHTKNAWAEISIELNRSFVEMTDEEKNEFVKDITKRWWNIRDGFVKYRSKVKALKKSGASPTKIKRYVYNNQLQFLIKTKIKQEPETEDIIEDKNSEDTEDQTTAFKTPQSGNSGTRNRKLDPNNSKLVEALEKPINRHLSFFNGILPTLDTLDEDETLEFQLGVLQLISTIRQQRKSATTPHASVQAPENIVIEPQLPLC